MIRLRYVLPTHVTPATGDASVKCHVDRKIFNINSIVSFEGAACRAEHCISPRFAAFRRKARKAMDIILHLGAHRTASTSFQYYMRQNADENSAAGLAFWGPLRTRTGLLNGVIPHPGLKTAVQQLERARGRIAMRLSMARNRGVKQMIVSDENMIGSICCNQRENRLYGNIGARMARYNYAFSGKVTRVVLSIRRQDSYWRSALAFNVARGHSMPSASDLERIARSDRYWRDVISDVADALPGVEIMVLSHEDFAGLPEASLAAMAGRADVPYGHARKWMNRSPEVSELREILTDQCTAQHVLPDVGARWQPFNEDQISTLRDAYADDLFWLRAGADGLATLTEETGQVKAGQNPLTAPMIRGQNDGIEKRRMA